HKISMEEIKELNPKGIILSGGPHSVMDEDSFRSDAEIFNLDIPVLGICYGMQLMALHYGGEVEKSKKREYGKAVSELQDEAKLYADTPEKQSVGMRHGDKVKAAPADFQVDARSAQTPTAAMSHPDKQRYAVPSPP